MKKALFYIGFFLSVGLSVFGSIALLDQYVPILPRGDSPYKSLEKDATQVAENFLKEYHRQGLDKGTVIDVFEERLLGDLKLTPQLCELIYSEKL